MGEKETDKHGFRTAKSKKVKLALLIIPVCYMWLSQELHENPTQLPKMLTRLSLPLLPSDCSGLTSLSRLTNPASWV